MNDYANLFMLIAQETGKAALEITNQVFNPELYDGEDDEPTNVTSPIQTFIGDGIAQIDAENIKVELFPGYVQVTAEEKPFDVLGYKSKERFAVPFDTELVGAEFDEENKILSISITLPEDEEDEVLQSVSVDSKAKSAEAKA